MEQIKHVGDAMSITAIAATIVGWLPSVAVVLSIVWTLIRIYETKTVQAFLKKHRSK